MIAPAVNSRSPAAFRFAQSTKRWCILAAPRIGSRCAGVITAPMQ